MRRYFVQVFVLPLVLVLAAVGTMLSFTVMDFMVNGQDAQGFYKEIHCRTLRRVFACIDCPETSCQVRKRRMEAFRNYRYSPDNCKWCQQRSNLLEIKSNRVDPLTPVKFAYQSTDYNRAIQMGVALDWKTVERDRQIMRWPVPKRFRRKVLNSYLMPDDDFKGPINVVPKNELKLQYPSLAKSKGLEGRCEVYFEIDRYGNAIYPEAKCTNTIFKKFAEADVASMDFEPMRGISGWVHMIEYKLPETEI